MIHNHIIGSNYTQQHIRTQHYTKYIYITFCDVPTHIYHYMYNFDANNKCTLCIALYTLGHAWGATYKLLKLHQSERIDR